MGNGNVLIAQKHIERMGCGHKETMLCRMQVSLFDAQPVGKAYKKMSASGGHVVHSVMSSVAINLHKGHMIGRCRTAMTHLQVVPNVLPVI